MEKLQWDCFVLQKAKSGSYFKKLYSHNQDSVLSEKTDCTLMMSNLCLLGKKCRKLSEFSLSPKNPANVALGWQLYHCEAQRAYCVSLIASIYTQFEKRATNSENCRSETK